MDKSKTPAGRKTRETLAAMTPERYQQIREAYYKAAEGLRALQDLLAEEGNSTNGLNRERRLMDQAAEHFNHSTLGSIL